MIDGPPTPEHAAPRSAPSAVRVMRPYLPERAQFDRLIDGIWDREQFTNEGPLAQRLAREVRDWLGVDRLQLVSSGAAALQLALRALDIRGSVVTTPFTFAASPHSIVLSGLRPIFADIDPTTLCLDPVAAERAIAADTGAILATHVFGIPCRVEAFAEIGERCGVKIVYDGAHAFGTSIGDRSIFAWGDAAALSFHATKLFHTVEGGAVVTRHAEVDEIVRVAKMHGIKELEVPMVGTNAKLSELHAAVGLATLPHMEREIAERRERYASYCRYLADVDVRIVAASGCDWNHAYFPVLFENEDRLIRAQSALASRNIDSRRYFYPPLNTLPFYDGTRCPIAEDVSRRILCLPFGSWIDDGIMARIAETMALAMVHR